MRVVYKYSIPARLIVRDGSLYGSCIFDQLFTLALPQGAQLLEMGVQNDHFFVWALVDPSAKEILRSFAFLGTGHKVQRRSEDLVYISSWVSTGLVFHLFEVKEEV